MKKNWFILSALVLMLASCGGSQKACYQITLTADGRTQSVTVYANEAEADAQADLLKRNFLMSGIPEERLSVQMQKLNKSEADCIGGEQSGTEIKRTVKPTATFSMSVTGLSVCSVLHATCCKVAIGGHSSSPLMVMDRLSEAFTGKYDDVTFGEYVKDNSYVGARIICIETNPYDGTASDHMTEEDKAIAEPVIDHYLQSTPDGPIQWVKSCTWTFRLGRDSTYTYVDEVIESFPNKKAFKDALFAHDSNNPIFQSLYFYDAKKDEFILQDRKSWNLK